jgi:hypothetical protein
LITGLAIAIGAAALPVIGIEPVEAIEGWMNNFSKVERLAGQVLQAQNLAPQAFLAAPMAALTAILAGTMMLRRRPRAAALCCILGAALFLPALAHLTAPALTRVFVSPRITAALERLNPNGHHDLLAVGFHEPSLVFLAGTQTTLASPQTAARDLAERPAAIAAVARRHKAEFFAETARLGVATTVYETISGLNYSTGRAVIIDIVSRTDRP